MMMLQKRQVKNDLAGNGRIAIGNLRHMNPVIMTPFSWICGCLNLDSLEATRKICDMDRLN